MRGKNVANTVDMRAFSSKMLQLIKHQNVANSMENGRFQLQNVAKIVEMAASSILGREREREREF